MNFRAAFESLLRRPDEVALQYAALIGDDSEVSLMLNKGVDPNARDCSGWTSLHAAAARGHSEVINSLLSAGANPVVRDKNGVSALDIARSRGYTKAMLLLSAAERNRALLPD